MVKKDNKKELHLFIIWEKGREKQDMIVSDISTRFQVLGVYEIEWTPDRVPQNYSRFYGTYLPSDSEKVKHCGVGPFVLLLVLDNSPIYDVRSTSHGQELVNVNMFDAKATYRDWTGGGHRVHATNNQQETNHDLTLLLGVNADDYLQKHQSPWTGDWCRLQQDLAGAPKWESLEQFFYVINNTIDNVVLRGEENLTGEESEKHGDIDILVDGYRNAILLMSGRLLCNYPIRPKVEVTISERKYIFDLWDLNKDYYSKSWTKDMLANRLMNDRGSYRLDPLNAFYSLLYHSFVHKPAIADDYYPRLLLLFRELGLDAQWSLDDYAFAGDMYFMLLKTFMEEKGYEYLYEKSDDHLFFNEVNVKAFSAFDYLSSHTPMEQLQPYMVGRYYSWSGYFYFRAFYKGKKAFVKYGGLGNSCRNEYLQSKMVFDTDPVHFVKPFFCLSDQEHKMVAFEFLEGIPLERWLSASGPEGVHQMEQQLEEIYGRLQQSHVMHRDINPDNFCVVSNYLKLYDFQYAISSSQPKELPYVLFTPHIIMNVGGKCRFKKYGWKDSVSFLKTAEMLGLTISIDTSDKTYYMPVTHVALHIVRDIFYLRCQVLFKKASMLFGSIFPFLKLKTERTKDQAYFVVSRILQIFITPFRSK